MCVVDSGAPAPDFPIGSACCWTQRALSVSGVALTGLGSRSRRHVSRARDERCLLGTPRVMACTGALARDPCHPSVQPRGPQRRWGEEPLQAGLEAADAAPEQGGQAAAEAAGLSIRDFFSSGVAPWAVSHIPVETAQNSASAMTRISRSNRSERRRWLSSRPKPRVLKSENIASIPHLRR